MPFIENIVVTLVCRWTKGIFKPQKNRALWGVKYGEKTWTKLVEGPERFLKLYQPKYFGEGWRTEILEPGLDRNKLPNA